jgi:sporulation protein YlmC with PRC-barrel domain
MTSRLGFFTLCASLCLTSATARGDSFVVPTTMMQYSKLVGAPIVASDGAPLAKLDDVMIDARSGEILVAVVTLASDGKRVALPACQFTPRLRDEKVELVSIHDRAHLEKGPAWDGSIDKLADRAWLETCYQHYGLGHCCPVNDPFCGWGPRGALELLYANATDIELQGKLIRAELIDLVEGLCPAVQLSVDVEGVTRRVVLGPNWWVLGSHPKLTNGVAIHVRGRELRIPGYDLSPEPVVMAATVTNDSRAWNIRDEQGHAGWYATLAGLPYLTGAEMLAAHVYLPTDARLGKVVDLAIDLLAGKARYLAVEPVDHPEEAWYAIPFCVLTPIRIDNELRLRMAVVPPVTAPRFTRETWNMALAPEWGAYVLDYYGCHHCWYEQPLFTSLYDPRGVAQLRGRILSIEHATGIAAGLNARSTGEVIRILSADGPVTVELAPADYFTRHETLLTRTGLVTVWGWWCDECHLIARRIQVGDVVLDLRDANGRPLWLEAAGPAPASEQL